MFGLGKKRQLQKNSIRPEGFEQKQDSAPKSSVKMPVPSFNFKMLRSVSSILDGSILTSDLVAKMTPYFVFLFVLAMIYIGNNYVAQSKVKEIDKINKELKDLRDEHISTKSNLMYFTKRSELAKRLKARGVQEATKPPYKIYVKKKEVK